MKLCEWDVEELKIAKRFLSRSRVLYMTLSSKTETGYSFFYSLHSMPCLPYLVRPIETYFLRMELSSRCSILSYRLLHFMWWRRLLLFCCILMFCISTENIRSFWRSIKRLRGFTALCRLVSLICPALRVENFILLSKYLFLLQSIYCHSWHFIYFGGTSISINVPSIVFFYICSISI